MTAVNPSMAELQRCAISGKPTLAERTRDFGGIRTSEIRQRTRSKPPFSQSISRRFIAMATFVPIFRPSLPEDLCGGR